MNQIKKKQWQQIVAPSTRLRMTSFDYFASLFALSSPVEFDPFF